MKNNRIANLNKILQTTVIISVAGIIFPLITGATDDISVEVSNTATVSGALERARNYFLGIVIIACVFMILWGGFTYVTSGGDEKKVENGKKTIFYAVIGLMIALLANAIVSLAQGIALG